MNEDAYLTLKQAAQNSGISYAVLRREVESGRLPAFRVGRKYFLAHSDLDAFCAQRGASAGGYSVRQLTERLPLSYAFLMELIHKGELPAIRCGGRYLVTEQALRSFLERNKVGGSR